MFLYVVVFLVLLALVFYHLSQNTSSKDSFSAQNIVIFGLSSSGKTRLFYKITENSLPLVTTSFTINRQKINVREKEYEIVDIPGHPSFQQDVLNNLQNGTVLLMMVNTEQKFFNKKCYR